MTDLRGKSVLITGGASGIGAASAILAAKYGARVMVADIDEPGSEKVVAQIRDAGGEVGYIRTDISDETQVREMVAATVAAFGRLDCAFNNAALVAHSHQPPNPHTLLADMSIQVFERGQHINTSGTFLCLKYEIEAMLKAGGGSIVNTSSCAGVVAIEGAADYVAAKHAVIGLTKSAALDYAASNIRVNAVIPGVIRTPALEKSFAERPELFDWAAAVQPNKRLGRPEEVGEGALWLLSDAASFVTGTSLCIDGGYTMV